MLEPWEIEQIRDYVIAPAILIVFSVWVLAGLWGWFKSGYNSSKKYKLLKGVITVAVVLMSSLGVLYILFIPDWSIWIKLLLMMCTFLLLGYWSKFIFKN